MILRTPPFKRRAHSKQPEDGNPSSGNRPLVIFEDSPSPSPRNFRPNALHLSMPPNGEVRVFDALSSAEKQARDNQSKLEALNNDYLKADAERKKFRDQFLNAEQELAAAKGREEALQDQLMKEVKISQERLRKQLQLYGEIEVKFQHEMNLHKKAETSAAAAEEKVTILERKLSSVSESIEREKNRLGNELEQLKSESKFSVTKISKNLERMEFRATNAEKESILLKEQLEELRKRLDKEAEVHEARKLKSSHENIELLKEKILEEKGRRGQSRSC